MVYIEPEGFKKVLEETWEDVAKRTWALGGPHWEPLEVRIGRAPGRPWGRALGGPLNGPGMFLKGLWVFLAGPVDRRIAFSH